MAVYVAEIDGRAVVAFNAENDLEAQVVIEDEIFQNDLAVLESRGRPIWDGESWMVYLLPVSDPTDDKRIET